MWSGKIIGTIMGLLFAGWPGALAGLILGHITDVIRRHKRVGLFGQFGVNTEAKQIFFDTTFLVMGYVAKSDGRVDEDELNAARNVMHRLGLSENQRIQAMRLFTEGKSATFDLDNALTQLIRFCHGNFILLHVFTDLQLQVARASGWVTPEKQQVLQRIFSRIGYVPFEFYFSRSQQKGHYDTRSFESLDKTKQAYALLGVQESSTNDEIKVAYRKLISQHHPDKLIAKGLPEEMLKMATEKAQNIQLAYDLIRGQRGF